MYNQYKIFKTSSYVFFFSLKVDSINLPFYFLIPISCSFIFRNRSLNLSCFVSFFPDREKGGAQEGQRCGTRGAKEGQRQSKGGTKAG